MNILCINLEHRTDRLEETAKEFKKLGYTFERVAAIYEKKKGLGCALSHIKCLKIAKEKNYKTCMVCEDDVKFEIDKHNFELIVNNFINSDADVIVLIGNHYTGYSMGEYIINYNDYFYQTRDTQTTTCYLVKNTYYDKLLKNFDESATLLAENYPENNYCERTIDSVWKKLQKHDGLWICPKIYCGAQRESYSDIEKRVVDYEDLFRGLYNITKYIIINLDGGLGNQLFQFAFGLAYSRKFNRTLLLNHNSITNNHSANIYSETFFKNVFTYQNNLIINKEMLQISDMTSFQCNALIEYHENSIYFNGYFQNEDYFIDYVDDIKKLLKCDEKIYNYLTEKYKNLDKAFFVHVRRGDYLNTAKEYHYVDLDNYYRSTIEKILMNSCGDCVIYLFSNGIDHCKCSDIYQFKNIIFVENENEINSMYLMSLCNLGGICANSTFSWWGGYLNNNKDKQVYFPNKWIGNMSQKVDKIGFNGSILIDVITGNITNKIN